MPLISGFSSVEYPIGLQLHTAPTPTPVPHQQSLTCICETSSSSEEDWSQPSTPREWSVPATPCEVSVEALEANCEHADLELDREVVDLGQPVVLFAPVRWMTRNMAGAEGCRTGTCRRLAAPCPKRTIRKVILDYANIIKGPATPA
ncbi:hypothetical protein MVEG_02392 [Podila verticillata NRRL 6337]|nr:hypothetical protein MVEG_02392 [Podila verticillata NRRL 6337]